MSVDPVSLGLLAASIALQIAAQLLAGPVKRSGPRLDDLSPTGIQPGAVIPRTHGYTVTTGTVIAQTRLQEHKQTETVGGKGSPSVTTTTYSYSIPAVAVAISAREIGGIVRIKANEKTIYEQTEDAGLVYRDFDEIEIFYGTEGQMPSAILEAQEGAGEVPAYRGTAYFVLSQLQLADFGNRMPIFRIEVAEAFDSTITSAVGADDSTDDIRGTEILYDFANGKAYARSTSTGAGYPATAIYEYDLSTLGYSTSHDLTGIANGAAYLIGVDPETGYLVGAHPESPTGPYAAYVYDPATETVVADVSFTDQNQALQTPYPDEVGAIVIKHATSGAGAVLSTDHSNLTQVHTFPALGFQQTFANPEPGVHFAGGTFLKWQAGSFGQGAQGEAWLPWVSSTELRFYKYTIDSVGTVTQMLAGTILNTDLHATYLLAPYELNTFPYYISQDGALLFFIEMGHQSGTDILADTQFLVRWHPDSGVVWSTEVGLFETSNQTRQGVVVDATRAVFYIPSGSYAYEVDLNTGAVTQQTFSGDATNFMTGSGAWDGGSDCFYVWQATGFTFQVIRRYCYSAGVAGGTSIGAILRAAMTEWMPDTSPLTEGDHFDVDAALFADPYLVTGATFTDLHSPREIAELCVLWKPVVFYEGGDHIVFKPRDGTSAATVRHQDAGARGLDETVKPTVTTSRQDDAQLPREVRIKYLDANRLFSANAAYARITRSRSSLVQEYELPFCGTPAEAKFAAWTAMGEAYAQRRSMSADLPLPYVILEPGDVVSLPDSEGDLIECRVSQSELGANNIIALKATDHVNSYDNVTFAADTGTIDAIALTRPLASLMYALDLPRLTDDPVADDGLQLLIGLGGTYSGWKGGAIYRDALSGGAATAFGTDYSGSETDFREVAQTALSVDAGTVTTAPSGTVDEFTIDRISTMRITFDTYLPVFATLTDAQFASGYRNTFAVGNNTDGWEIIQAQTATKISDQVWDFSTLRRGMRGTEWAIGQAEAGDSAIALSMATLQRDAFTEGAIGQVITYRGVTFNTDVASAADYDVTVVGRGLIPFAPLLGQVYRDGTGEITGTLYARPWQADSADQFFLAGADFEIDIKDAPGGSVLRTLTLTDTGAFTYMVVDQTTDFGAAEPTVDAEIYQLDDDGNRGYGREVVL